MKIKQPHLKNSNMMAKLQRFGGAMFTPVIFFVFSGIIVGLSSVATNPDIIGAIAKDGTIWSTIWKVIDAGGWTVFNNMEILFVIGLPLGLANKAKERAALEAFVLYLTFNNFVNAILTMFGSSLGVNFKAGAGEGNGLKMIAGVKTLDTGVVGAIILAGIVVWLHNKYYDVKLPDWLGIFQGSAFVAMIGFFFMIPVAALFSWSWPILQGGISSLQSFMVRSGDLGVFTFIFLEKALLPTGLHHFIYAPFQYGPAIVPQGTTLYWMEHIKQFANSTLSLKTLYPQGGFSMQGMSNIFGIPGIAAAFYVTAKKENRKKVLALIVPGVLTAVFAGITEPFDYTFLFIAPVLFFVHAVLAACLATTMYIAGVTGDMGGGLIEIIAKNYIPMWHNHWITYVIQWGIGLSFIIIYFFVFRFLILKFNFMTPGRAIGGMVNMFTKKDYKDKENGSVNTNPFRDRAGAYLKLLGGSQNIQDVTNCVTRLRVTVKDEALVDPNDQAFISAEAKGIVRNGNALQVIVGMDVSNVRSEFDELLNNPTPETITEAAPVVHEILSSPAKGQVIPLEQVNDEVFSKKMMGNGFAITEHDGHIYAPIDGEITSIFPTKHALIITTLAGTGILIHLGLDTVELEGAPFDIKVTEQQKIKHGDLLAVMDLKQIQEAQKDATVIVITPDDQSGQLLKQDVAVDVTDEVFEH